MKAQVVSSQMGDCQVNRIPDLDRPVPPPSKKQRATDGRSISTLLDSSKKVKEEVRIDLHPHPLQGLDLDLVT